MSDVRVHRQDPGTAVDARPQTVPAEEDADHLQLLAGHFLRVDFLRSVGRRVGQRLQPAVSTRRLLDFAGRHESEFVRHNTRRYQIGRFNYIIGVLFFFFFKKTLDHLCASRIARGRALSEDVFFSRIVVLCSTI